MIVYITAINYNFCDTKMNVCIEYMKIIEDNFLRVILHGDNIVKSEMW